MVERWHENNIQWKHILVLITLFSAIISAIYSISTNALANSQTNAVEIRGLQTSQANTEKIYDNILQQLENINNKLDNKADK